MLKSESIVMYENAIYRNDETEKEGILVITEYRLIFMFSVPEEEYIYLRLLSLNKLDRSNDKKNVGKYFLEIMTKDNRTFKFYILKDEQQKLYQHLLKYENPKEISIFYKFAYKYRESHPVNNDGWNIYDPLLEFERQGLHFENKVEEVNHFIILRGKNLGLLLIQDSQFVNLTQNFWSFLTYLLTKT